MKRKYLLLILCLVSAFGCSLDRGGLSESVLDSTFYGVLEDICNTKTFLGEDNYVRWSSGDEVMIFNGYSIADRYHITEVSAGQKSASFDYDGPVTDDFVSGYNINHNVALYPLSEEVHCNSILSDGQLEGYALVNVELPSRQSYRFRSFADDSYPMIALTNSVQDKRLAFKNVCGCLKLNLTGERSISSITLRGNDGELLAGACEIITYLTDKVPFVKMLPSAETEIKLDCGEDGVALDKEDATTFIISVPPVKFSKGFSLLIEDTQGVEFVLRTSKENEILRSTMLVMPDADVDECDEPMLDLSAQDVTLSGDEAIFEVDVYSNVDYEIILPEQDWISETSDSESARRKFTVGMNDDYSSRKAEIIFRNLRHGLVRSLTVNQEGGKALPSYVLTTVYDVSSSIESLNKRVTLPLHPAGNDNEIVVIDYGDGCFGTESSHTYQEEGEYAIKFYFEKPVTEIASSAFSSDRIKKITVPSDVEVIRNNAFFYSLLEEITFESNNELLYVEDGAFFSTKLKEITLPGSLKEVGYAIFGQCKDLENICIGNNEHFSIFVLSDMDYHSSSALAYYDNNSCTIVAYPPAGKTKKINAGVVKKLAGAAFAYCNNLIECHISGLEIVEQYNFAYCQNLESVSMHSVRSIGQNVLFDCDNLTDVDLPKVFEIGKNSICGNATLRYVNITSPELSEINGIINDNPSLESVIIPEGITSINDSFNALPSLKQIEVRATTPPVVVDSFDSFSAELCITVPAEALDTYKQADFWKTFADCIVAAE